MCIFGGFSVSIPHMAKTEYAKTPKTFREQVELLKQRNLTIANEERAENILTYISYNRLSNYWFPLLAEPKADEIFKDGATFDAAFKLYQFDSDFRTITFHAIEQIEIAIRTQIIYHFSIKYDSGFWYEDSSAFKNYQGYLKLLNKIATNSEETKQDFIVRYKEKYEQFMPPSWKSFELLTFNSLLGILKNAKDFKDLIPIARSFGLHHSVLISWVDSFVYVRNICAHHGRLWNRKLTKSPKWIKSPKKPWIDRWENEDKNVATEDKELKIYAIICAIIYCLEFVNPYSKYGNQLITLFEKYPVVDLMHMGFPEDWKDQPLWSKFL